MVHFLVLAVPLSCVSPRTSVSGLQLAHSRLGMERFRRLLPNTRKRQVPRIRATTATAAMTLKTREPEIHRPDVVASARSLTIRKAGKHFPVVHECQIVNLQSRNRGLTRCRWSKTGANDLLSVKRFVETHHSNEILDWTPCRLATLAPKSSNAPFPRQPMTRDLRTTRCHG